MRYKVGYHSIPNYYERRAEMREWCDENVGVMHINWKFKNWNWYFRFKKDYSHFLLRWS